MDHGPHRICRSGKHCLALTGMTSDGRCLACRRDSHRRAQATYYGTAKGQTTHIKHDAKERA
jgi:hypothetical protein